jgi:type II secretory pathway pseudopilin PulG
MRQSFRPRSAQQGFTLLTLLLWAIIIGFVALVAMRVLPTVNEYFTIQRAINNVAAENLATVPEIRSAFEKQKQIEYSITSISGKDLDVTKENDKVVISFAYNKEIELMSPVFLLIKYEGRSK